MLPNATYSRGLCWLGSGTSRVAMHALASIRAPSVARMCLSRMSPMTVAASAGFVGALPLSADRPWRTANTAAAAAVKAVSREAMMNGSFCCTSKSTPPIGGPQITPVTIPVVAYDMATPRCRSSCAYTFCKCEKPEAMIMPEARPCAARAKSQAKYSFVKMKATVAAHSAIRPTTRSFSPALSTIREIATDEITCTTAFMLKSTPTSTSEACPVSLQTTGKIGTANVSSR